MALNTDEWSAQSLNVSLDLTLFRVQEWEFYTKHLLIMRCKSFQLC
jgi:hypothetical protein